MVYPVFSGDYGESEFRISPPNDDSEIRAFKGNEPSDKIREEKNHFLLHKPEDCAPEDCEPDIISPELPCQEDEVF